ncbi:MAG: class B sortase, partial [Dysosmobacter sp.]
CRLRTIVLYITDDNGSHKYEIFAAYEVSTAGTTYQIGFSGDASKQAFLDYCLGQSVIDTGITPTVHDKILTLSTCTGNGHATRWVVQARLKGVAPSDRQRKLQDPRRKPRLRRSRRLWRPRRRKRCLPQSRRRHQPAPGSRCR